MSERHTSTDDIVEQQMDALEQSQRTLTRSTMAPFQQAVRMQRNLGEVFLSGLEMSESVQKLGTDMTRSAFRSYLDSVEDAAGAMQGQQPQGQQPQGRQGQQQRGAGGQQMGPSQEIQRETGPQQSGQQPPQGRAPPSGQQSPQGTEPEQPGQQYGQQPPRQIAPQQTPSQQPEQQYGHRSPQQMPPQQFDPQPPQQ